MDEAEREYFDGLLELEVEQLPPRVHRLLHRVPLIVEDHPSDQVIAEFELGSRDELCGLHDGIPLTDRTVEGGDLDVPEHIMIYREGIVTHANHELADGQSGSLEDEVRRQIRVTILHEVGHHFGLNEDDLDELGYG